MENKIATSFCKKLINSGIVSQELEDIYIYGLELFLSFIISTTLILTIGIIINKTIETLIFLATFILVRRLTGGYHASTYLKCKIVTILSFLTVIFLTQIIKIGMTLILITAIIGLMIIIKWGPIENPNKPLSIETIKKCKILSIIVYEGLIAFASVTYKTISNISTTIIFSLIVIIALMLFAILKERSNSHEED